MKKYAANKKTDELAKDALKVLLPNLHDMYNVVKKKIISEYDSCFISVSEIIQEKII